MLSTTTTPESTAPRIGVGHLIVATACISFCLAVTRGNASASPVHNQPSWMAGFDVVLNISSGIALAGLWMAVYRRLRGISFPRFPGELLLVLMGAMVIVWMGILSIHSMIYLARGPNWEAHEYRMFEILAAIGTFVSACMYGYGIYWTHVRRWRAFFASVAILYLLHAICQYLLPLFGIYVYQNHAFVYFSVSTGTLIAIAVVIFLDIVRSADIPFRLPWTHWLGAFAFLMYTATETVFWAVMIAPRFLP